MKNGMWRAVSRCLAAKRARNDQTLPILCRVQKSDSVRTLKSRKTTQFFPGNVLKEVVEI